MPLSMPLSMPALSRAAVWLLAPPHPGIHKAVWRVVACFAIEAMEYGRRLLWARRHSPDWPDPGPAGLQLLRAGLPDDVVAAHVWPRVRAERQDISVAVSNMAAARFWCNLHDFAAAHRHQPPRQLVDPAVPAHHPFLSWDGHALRAQLPVDVEALALA